jgi:hypothetical protein
MSSYLPSNDLNTPRYSSIYGLRPESIGFHETSCSDVIVIPSLLFLCNGVESGLPIFRVIPGIILFNIFSIKTSQGYIRTF